MVTEGKAKAVTKRQPDQTVPAHTARSVLTSMAARYSTDAGKLLETLKNTAFKAATNEQLMALCIVADQYRLNPFTKEIYAFPDKSGGIVPVVGIDGWLRIINDHPQYDGMEVEGDDAECTVTIHRKDRAHPTRCTEYMSECRRKTAPWDSHPARMLRHKTIIQCARMAFGFALKDPDEAERIMEADTRPPIAPPRVIEVVPDPAELQQTETTVTESLPLE
jgi:phage recombination protein Bet